MLNGKNKCSSCWRGNGSCMAPVQIHFVILSKHLLFCPYLVPIWMTVFIHWGVCGVLYWLNLFLPSSSWHYSIDFSPLHREYIWGARWVASSNGAHPPHILSGAACPQRWPAPPAVRIHSENVKKRGCENRSPKTRPYKGHLASLSLSFLTYKMEALNQMIVWDLVQL